MKHYLKDVDWVMWLDADTIITNPEIRLESLLVRRRACASGSSLSACRKPPHSSSRTYPCLQPRSSSGPDFIITVDGGGYNAGIWLMRRSEWSSAFLDSWWSMKQYIRVRWRRCHHLMHNARLPLRW